MEMACKSVFRTRLDTVRPTVSEKYKHICYVGVPSFAINKFTMQVVNNHVVLKKKNTLASFDL